MLHKSFDLLETKTDGDTGEFTAIVSTFGNVDRVGDRIMPGAWTKSLEQWAASGDPIPIILAHQWDDPMAHIGIARAQDVKQVEQGLQVKGKLDVEDNPVAKQVYKLMKRRSLKEFSIGYDVPRGGEKRARDGANEISQINLAECGPCLKGIDPKTELQSVKSAMTGMSFKQLASVTRELLDAAGRERYGSGQDTYAYVDDFDPDSDWVVFYISSNSQESRYVKTTYTVEADGTVQLGDTEVEVSRSTSYTPKSADAAAQRENAKRIAREVEQAQIPEVPEQPKALTEPGIDFAKELQEVKAQLAETRQALEDLRKKADETDKEPKARSVDPLRKQAESVALEIASGGESLRKPPKTVEQKQPEPSLSLRELKQRTRDEMLGVLSGGIIE